MAIANLQAQMANLTSLVSQYIEQTTMQGVPTFETSYRHEYQTNQRPQIFENGGWDGVNAWDYHDYNQSRNDIFSNTCNTHWGDHSNLMWEEPQHEEYWQPNEEFYFEPMQPTQFPPQFAQPQSGTSQDNDEFIELLTSLTQGMQNQAKEVGELKKQMGQLVECMAQIQVQSELSSSIIDNSTREFEIIEPIMSQHRLQVDNDLLFKEEDEEHPMAKIETSLPQPSHISTPPDLGKVVPNSCLSNPIPPNIIFPCRFLQSKKGEGGKDIFKTFPRIEVEEVVFVIKFVLEHMGMPHFRISILFHDNLLLMIQAPTPKLRSLPHHFKYHRPFKDQNHYAVGSHEV